jgi:Holliday junction resolvase RusA-like endonuclease
MEVRLTMAYSFKKRQQEYDNKYGGIPTDYRERLMYMCDKMNMSHDEMISIMQDRDRRMMNMYYTTLRVVLYQIPQGAKRPRYRICRKNLVSSAIANPDFIHVYSPDAAANHNYMRKIVNQQEIIQLEHLICTPCDVHYRAFFPTPSSYSKQEIFMAEIGLIRPLVKPDFDNIEKLYADMYNSNVWIDDALTVDATIGKYYSILPRVEIDLGYLNAVYCKQQYNNIISRKDYDTSMRLTYI